MIFAHTWEWIAGCSPHTGLPKTQTRRPMRWGDRLVGTGFAVANIGGNPRYEIGKTYAVQAGRGKRALWWKEDEDEFVHCGDRVGLGILYSDGDALPGEKIDKSWLWYHGYAPLRIRITSLRDEDVRQISAEDAAAEGFASPEDFLAVWNLMHKTYDAWVIGFELVR